MRDQSFIQALRQQVVAQASLLEALTAHPTLIGTGRERAVIDLLRGQLPRRYEVLTGTVISDADEGWQKENRQLDVMVVDTFDYPTILRNGDIAVVLPESVAVIVEVKSSLAAPPDPDTLQAGGERGRRQSLSGPGNPGLAGHGSSVTTGPRSANDATAARRQ